MKRIHYTTLDLKHGNLIILALFLGLILLSVLHAQTVANAPAAQTNAAEAAASAPSAGQAPDDATKKITELVHAGKYVEAQQLTAGLLIAYPNDQRLLKAKALIQKLLAPAGHATPGSGQPAASADAEQLTGMDKIDYNALIVLARQARQDTDLEQQKGSLKQFMDQSSVFLQKHPDQMLLWELRGQSAISLNDPMAGYEAGQKLLAMGAADSNDPTLQELLAQLKNKGWLEQQNAQEAERNWMLGTWSISVSHSWPARHKKPFSWDEGSWTWSIGSVEFSSSASVIEGRYISADGVRSAEPHYRGTVLDSGEIRWEHQDILNPGYPLGWATDPDRWTQATSFTPGKDNRTMKMVFPSATCAVGCISPTGDTLIFTKK
jgi:hypothetical protein